MKKAIQLLLFLAALSAISGYLMSQMSFVGRIGINIIHRDYKFLKIWWQGAITVYTVLLAVFLIHALLHKILQNVVAKIVHFLFFTAGVVGMYFTFVDFEDDFTHKLLRQRFHIGAYLFWVGCMLISLFFITQKKSIKSPTNSDKKVATN